MLALYCLNHLAVFEEGKHVEQPGLVPPTPGRLLQSITLELIGGDIISLSTIQCVLREAQYPLHLQLRYHQTCNNNNKGRLY